MHVHPQQNRPMFRKGRQSFVHKRTHFTQWVVFFAILCGVLYLPACTTKKVLPPFQAKTATQPAKKHQTPKIPNDNNTVSKKLNTFYQKWKNTPYRYGGMSHRGIDCSALIVVAYRELFSLDLPRTVSQQAKVGQPIPRSSMQPGDLIFFKTGFSQKHIGISLGGQSFLHVSELKGVIISHLDNIYWKDRFLEARRVL